MKYLLVLDSGAFDREVYRAASSLIPASELVAVVNEAHLLSQYSRINSLIKTVLNPSEEMLSSLLRDTEKVFLSLPTPQAASRGERLQNLLAVIKDADVAHLVTAADLITYDGFGVRDLEVGGLCSDAVIYRFKHTEIYYSATLESENYAIMAAISNQPVYTSFGDAKIGFATQKDYALASVGALIESPQAHTSYTLSGAPITMSEFAQELGSVLGKSVMVRHVDDATFAHHLASRRMPEQRIAEKLEAAKAYRQGKADHSPLDLEKLLSRFDRQPTSLKKGFEELLAALNRGF